MLPVVEREAQVLKLVVHLVADAVRHPLGEGLREVDVPEVEEAPERDGGDEYAGEDGELCARCGRAAVGGDSFVYGAADELWDRKEEERGEKERRPGANHAPSILRSELCYTPDYIHRGERPPSGDGA